MDNSNIIENNSKTFSYLMTIPNYCELKENITFFTNIPEIVIKNMKQDGDTLKIILNINTSKSQLLKKNYHFNREIPIITEKIHNIKFICNAPIKSDILKNKYDIDGKNKHIFAIYATNNTFPENKNINKKEHSLNKKRNRSPSIDLQRKRSRNDDYYEYNNRRPIINNNIPIMNNKSIMDINNDLLNQNMMYKSLLLNSYQMPAQNYNDFIFTQRQNYLHR